MVLIIIALGFFFLSKPENCACFLGNTDNCHHLCPLQENNLNITNFSRHSDQALTFIFPAIKPIKTKKMETLLHSKLR